MWTLSSWLLFAIRCKISQLSFLFLFYFFKILFLKKKYQKVPPTIYNCSPANQGTNNCTNSDVTNCALRESSCFNLGVGVTDNCHNGGFFPYGAIGEIVWHDSNANGILDNSETGVTTPVEVNKIIFSFHFKYKNLNHFYFKSPKYKFSNYKNNKTKFKG